MPIPIREAAVPWVPNTATRNEALRVEIEKKQASTLNHASQRLSMYRSRSPDTMARPLDWAKLATDARVQDAAAMPGHHPTAPHSRPGAAQANVNILRYMRMPDYGGAIPYDGGRTYTAHANEDNWVEERRDKEYASGWHPKEMRLNKLWDTTYNASYVNTHDPAYAQATFKRNAVAKTPPPPQPTKLETPPVVRHNMADVVHYGREGFGSGARQDHTTHPKRGGHWVGVAPLRDHESVTTTVHGKSETLEFQMRTPTTDPRAKFLTETKPGVLSQDYWTQRTMKDLQASQLHTANWKSIYNRDFSNFSRTPTPSGATVDTTTFTITRPGTAAPPHSLPAVRFVRRPQTSYT